MIDKILDLRNEVVRIVALHGQKTFPMDTTIFLAMFDALTHMRLSLQAIANINPHGAQTVAQNAIAASESILEQAG